MAGRMTRRRRGSLLASRKSGGTAEAAKKLFPETLYVNHEDDGGDGYFIAQNDIEYFDDTDAVAIYELKDVRRKRVEHLLM